MLEKEDGAYLRLFVNWLTQERSNIFYR